MLGLSLALGLLSLSVCLSALLHTKGLHFAPTEHLLLGAAEHQLQLSSLGTGTPPAWEGHRQDMLGRTSGTGRSVSQVTLLHRHSCPVLGARALPARAPSCPITAVSACATVHGPVQAGDKCHSNP